MPTTGDFFLWYYFGLNSFGGWLIFFIIAVGATAWLFYDSQVRRIPALGWQMGAVLTAALLLPTIIWRFTSGDTRATLDPFTETFFYLGLLGGILPAVIAVGYYVTYRDLVGCERWRHEPYPDTLSKCPECEREDMALRPPAPVYVPPPQPAAAAREEASPGRGPLPERKPKVPAWLVNAGDGREYQLNAGVTRIGRGSRNDIQLTGNDGVSRDHAVVQETGGRFKITDVGSAGGTRVNGRLINGSFQLEPDDEIDLAGTKMRFVTTRGR